MTDTFEPEVQTLAEQQGQAQAVQAEAPNTQSTPPESGMALSFITAQPQQTAQPGQSPESGAAIEQFRARMHVVPGDAALIAYVNEHNRQNPNNPISLADASKEVRFAARETAPIFQAQPPTDFQGRIQETQQAQQATEAEIASASEAGDHQRVAQLMLHAARLEADIRDIQRDEQAWSQHAEQSQRQAQVAALEQAQSQNYDALVRQYPDLGVHGSPLRAAFEAEWQTAGNSNDTTLRSAQAPESILGRVIVRMGGFPQAQPAHRQAQTWPVIPGTASPTAMRNAPQGFRSESEIAQQMLNGEVPLDQLDAFLNARRY